MSHGIVITFVILAHNSRFLVIFNSLIEVNVLLENQVTSNYFVSCNAY